MLYGLILTLLAIAGIVAGAMRKNRVLMVASIVMLVLVVAVWAYFYTNPY